MNLRAAAVATTILLMGACADGISLMYPLPTNALEARHLRLVDTGDEQDFFLLQDTYPSTRAIEHYRNVFAGWTECVGKNSDWESYGDSSSGQLRYVRQFVRWWADKIGDTIVMVALRYESGDGIAPEQAAHQQVIVLRHKSSGAKNLAVQELSLRCET